MFLLIEWEEDLDISGFVEWLKDDIARTGVSGEFRDPNMEELWQSYFDTNDYGWTRDSADKPVVPSVEFVISSFFDNLTIYRRDNAYVIGTDSSRKLNGTDITIEGLAALMNFGTTTEAPYPLFNTVFDFYATNLQDMFDAWEEANGELDHLVDEEEEEEEADEEESEE